jgi:hypothetical protein
MSPIQQIMLGVSPGGEKYWIVADGSNTTSDNLDYRYIDVNSSGDVYVLGTVAKSDYSHRNYTGFHKYDKDGTNTYYKRYRWSGSANPSGSACGMGTLTNGEFIVGNYSGSNTYVAGLGYVSASSGAMGWQKNFCQPHSNTSGHALERMCVSNNNRIVGVEAGAGTGNKDIKFWEVGATGGLTNDWEISTRSSGSGSNYGCTHRALTFDSSGNFYMAGRRGGTSTYNSWGWICKFNTSMQLQWNRELGRNGSYELHAFNDIVVDSSGNVYLAGETRSGPTLGMVVKYNSSGVLQWQKELDHSSTSGSGNNLSLFGIDLDDDEDYIYVCGSQDGWGTHPMWAKIAVDGTYQWSRYLRDMSGNHADRVRCIKVKGDNLYLGGNWYIGSSKYHGLVMKLPADGSCTGYYGPSNTFFYSDYVNPLNNLSLTDQGLLHNGSPWYVGAPSATFQMSTPPQTLGTDTVGWSEMKVAKDICS